MSFKTGISFEDIVLHWNKCPITTRTKSINNQLPVNSNQTGVWQDNNGLAKAPFSNASPFVSYGIIQNTQIQTVPAIKWPKTEDMQYWVIAAIVLLFVRRLVERYVFTPLGKHLGIKDRPKLQSIPCPNPEAVSRLETAYRSSHKKLSREAIDKLSLQTNLKFREIERWLRKRRAFDRPSKLVKFNESGWRFVCYFISTSIGIWALKDKPWIWSSDLFWADCPNHDLSRETWIYYLFEAGLYISFLSTQFFDVKRKDFWEMFVHHVITVIYLSSTWTLNLTRLGVFGLCLHDCSDVFLEAAKMANYAKKEDLANGIFVSFMLVWIATRLIVYPKMMVIDGPTYFFPIEHFSSFTKYSFVGLLTLLFCLHVFWTYYICKVAISALNTAKVEKDSRSSTESDSSSSSNESEDHLKRKEEKRRSLQLDSGSSLLTRINTKQRVIMKRISIEIM